MKKMFQMVASFLGIDSFSMNDGKKVLTEEQKTKLTEAFGKEFVTVFEGKLSEDIDNNTDPEKEGLQAQVSALQTQLQEAQTALETATNATVTQKQEFESRIEELQSAINVLSEQDETRPPKSGAGASDNGEIDHTVALFGETNLPFMALEGRPYNQRAAQALAARQGIQINASNSIDYTKLGADLGEYYRTRRDTIHSMVRELPSVESIFPLHSGYQDQEVLLNAFLGEFSQAFQDAFTPKGKYDIEPEIIKMFDVKFDHKFSELKKMEKQWIGYLNKEGASAMKWSFIEFLLAETTKKLHNEREQRRIRGKYLAPTAGVAGASINGSDGLLTFVKNKISNLQIKPFALGEWNPNNIVEYVFNGSMMIPQDVRDTGSLVVYGSTDAEIWYKKNFESLYGKNTDYKGAEDKVKFLNSITFKAVPNMGSSKRLIWSVEGNICLFEDRPNEMTQYSFEQEDRTLKVWSDWRESVWAFVVGKKWDNEAEMDYEHQLIWCNDVDEPADYFIEVASDDTTPSVSVHTSIKTGINTQATVITDIDDMEVGQNVIVKCGSDNAYNSTIEASGNFSNMTAAWTPSLGDTITLFKRGAGDIIDLARTTASTDAEVIAADNTTPDVSGATDFVTSANTGATAITVLDNATAGVIYTIYGGSDDNSSTIADGRNFDLTANMTLEAGKYIKLYARTSTSFVELARG